MRTVIAAFGVLIGLQSLAVAGSVPADEASRASAQAAPARSVGMRAASLIKSNGSLAGLSQRPSAAAATQTKSRFNVTVPQDGADLFVDGVATTATGTSRVVESGLLERGKQYEYTFTVKWWPNGYTRIIRSKTIRFTAGETVAVDLTTADPNDRAEIRYVPTPEDIASEMVNLAKVSPDDVVFEPGCGDARITIAAVMAGAKRGVGIDIDAERVAASTANVKAAGLEGRIDIRLGDALDIKDLSDATVVFLYMGDEFDMLIRPMLWAQLKVGARVVSHRFKMGDWEPDTTVNVGDEYGYQLHLWTITEDVKRRAGKP
jgi:uncharacterized protein (TIGR03000 family)